jgi:PEP-CTERM motif
LTAGSYGSYNRFGPSRLGPLLPRRVVSANLADTMRIKGSYNIFPMGRTTNYRKVAAHVIALFALLMLPVRVLADQVTCEQKDGTICPGAPLNTPSQDVFIVDETHFTILVGADDKIQPGDLGLCEDPDPAKCKDGSALSDLLRFRCANGDGTNCTGQLYSVAGADPADVDKLPALMDPKFFTPEFQEGITGIVYLARGPTGRSLTYRVTSDTPEPGTMLLFGSALMGLAAHKLRKSVSAPVAFKL